MVYEIFILHLPEFSREKTKMWQSLHHSHGEPNYKPSPMYPDVGLLIVGFTTFRRISRHHQNLQRPKKPNPHRAPPTVVIAPARSIFTAWSEADTPRTSKGKLQDTAVTPCEAWLEASSIDVIWQFYPKNKENRKHLFRWLLGIALL